MAEFTIGEVPGITVGSVFSNREELRQAGVHRRNQHGIAGREAMGAESIVLNAGYEDDDDHGDLIIYTGEGGRDPSTGRQIEDQHLTRGNLALVRSHEARLPVRVVRGPKLKSRYAPGSRYRYDGLYRVEKYWSERGRSGFLVWRFQLRRADRRPQPWETGA